MISKPGSRNPSFLRALLLCSLALVACARGPAPERTGTPRPQAIARPLEVYQSLGFLAGPAEFPAVASFATLAGPQDSTFVLFALSLPNSALRFTRDNGGFLAQYNVSLSFLKDSAVIKKLEKREHVRVASFAETGRTDESIIFQDLIALPPGRYDISLHTHDAFSSRGFRGRDTLDVPSYGVQRKLSSPVLIYEGAGRSRVEARPEFIVNARKTVPYGAEVPRVYVELYNADTPQPIHLRVVDEKGVSVWQSEATIAAGNDRMRQALIEIPTASLPLGRLWLEAATAANSSEVIRSPLLVTISDQWMVANFDEVLRFITYVAYPAELDSLRAVSGAERHERWERFWQRRDPLKATPLNEFRDEFFQRVRFATENFAEAARSGWDTDRGEVYIVLGPPDHVMDRRIGRDANEPNAVEWLYENTPGGRLQLTFIDRAGFGHFELTQQSEHAFRTTANRMRPRGGSRP